MSAISGIRNQDYYSSYGNYSSQQPQKKPSIDSDGDNAISKDELSAFLSDVSSKTSEELDSEEIFSSLDSNGDGTISKDESKGLKEYLPKPPERKMAAEDDTNSTTQEMISLMKQNISNIYSAGTTDVTKLLGNALSLES